MNSDTYIQYIGKDACLDAAYSMIHVCEVTKAIAKALFRFVVKKGGGEDGWAAICLSNFRF